jgi:hypothetical protein
MEIREPSMTGDILDSPEIKIGKYKDMLGDSKAVFILAANTREAGKDKKLRADSYGDVDEHGYMAGGHARTIAAAEIGQYFPDVKLVANSCDPEKDVSLAKVYAQELENLGIPKKQIELQETSASTLTELVEMIKIAKRNGWDGVSVLTNDYHVPRAHKMLNHIEELAQRFNVADEEFTEAWKYFDKGKKLQVQFLQAEEILPLRDLRYGAIIDAVRKSDLYKKRVEAEERGIQQIEDGTYGRK